MEKYVIGIDGGGTGSKGIVADMRGQLLSRFRGGATNYNGGKKEEIDTNISNLLDTAVQGRKISDCQAICIGSAGVGNPESVSNIREVVGKKGFKCPVQITADSVTAHAGALNAEEGVVLIAGTGTICFGRKNNGEAMRTGGYGHLIDDEGSGYDIARRMLRAVVRAADGRGEQTMLRDLIFRQLQISGLGEMIGWLYQKERTKKEIAYLAVLLSEALEAGDAVAGKIVEEVAESLVEISAPVVDFFEKKTRVALSGSVLKFNNAIQEVYIRKMQEKYPVNFGTPEGVSICDAEHEADYGAVLLALKSLK